MDLEGRAPLRDVLVVLPGGRMIGDIPIRDRAEASQACQIALNRDPCIASKSDPFVAACEQATEGPARVAEPLA